MACLALASGLFLVMSLCVFGCAGEDTSADLSAPRSETGDNANNGAGAANSVNNGGNNAANNAGDNGGNNDFVPEEEEDFDFQAPRSSRNYVFVANTSLDSVAKVDAETLEITSIEVGDRPTAVRTFQAENLAVVLNEGSDEVTVIRAGDTSDYVRNVRIPADMNALALSPSGEFALAYFDFEAAQEDPDTSFGEAPPFQDVALIDLEEGGEVVYNLTVGFQVVDLEFDDLGERAFVITRTGVSVVDFDEIDGDTALPPVPVAEVDTEDDINREVEITGDGQFAFVRSIGLEGINVVDLESAEAMLVALSGIPTDLDIVPGTSRALAVVRQTNQLVLIDLPGAIEDPEDLETIELGDEPAGLAELTPDASQALVYTSVEERKAITVVDLEDATYEVHPLRKGVRGVTVSPDGQNAVIFHTKQPGTPMPGEPEDQFIAKSWAYSLFDIGSGYAKIETVPTEPGEFAFSDETGQIYLLLNDLAAEVRQVEIINPRTFRTDSLRLGSPPQHVGTIPNDGNPRVYISQEHPLGRMTFIDELTGDVKTVTGFQLNSLVE